jgi:MFS family permease
MKLMNRNFAILILAAGLSSFAMSIFGIIFPLYLDSLHISLPQIGLIFAIPVLLGIVTRVLVGIISDMHGRKPFFHFAIIGGGITSFLVARASTAWQFLSINLFESLSGAFNDATDHVLAYESADKKKVAEEIGKFKGVGNVFSFVGTIITGTLLVYLSFVNTFYVIGLVSFAAFVVFFKFKEKRNFGRLKYKSVKEFFDVSLLPKKMRIYTVASFFFDASNTMITTFAIQLFFTKYFGSSPVVLSLVLGLSTLMYALGALFLGKLADKFRPTRVCIYIFALVALLTVAMGVYLDFWVAALLWIFSGFFMGVVSPTMRKMINSYARPNFRGKDTNIARAVASMGQFVGPLIAGYVGAYSLGAVFVYSGFALALAAIPVWFIERQ